DEGAVAAALGGRALRLDPPIEYGPLSARLAVQGVALGGVAMTALYQFGLDGGLKQVLLEKREPGVNPKNFAAIEAALAAELGKPAAACERSRGSPKLVERRWTGDAGAAHLTLMDFTGAALRYDPNRDTTDPRVPSYEYTLYSRRSVPKRIVLRWFPAADKSLEGPAPCR
ncbi:MAG: hypothetical protein ACT4N4_05165, partial [Rhodospirillales bacterium]